MGASLDGITMKPHQKSHISKQQMTFIIDAGLDLGRAVKMINKTLQGILATTITTCTVSSALSLYLFVAISTLYQKGNVVTGLPIFSASAGTICLIYLVRLYYLTNCGQLLGNVIKEARFNLQEYRLENMKYIEDNFIVSQQLIVLQERMCCGDFPIFPFAVFSLSTSTFVRTIIAVLGYVVILIKLRGVESPNDVFSQNMHN